MVPKPGKSCNVIFGFPGYSLIKEDFPTPDLSVTANFTGSFF
jgi:hypothetical protein